MDREGRANPLCPPGIGHRDAGFDRHGTARLETEMADDLGPIR
jgi:hypothetical protein